MNEDDDGMGIHPSLSPSPPWLDLMMQDPVSPRALKHIEEMEAVVQKGDMKAILLFITQRSDVTKIRICKRDPQYQKAVRMAAGRGVVVKGLAVKWEGSVASFLKELDVDYGQCDGDDEEEEELPGGK